MNEETKLTPAEWGKRLGKRRRLLGVPGAMNLSGIPMDKPISQSEFERAMNKWRKKPAHRLLPARGGAPHQAERAASPDLSVVETADKEKGGKK